MTVPLRLIVLLLLLLASSSAFAQMQARLGRHPYPQMAGQNSVAILWRTEGGTIPIVRFGPAPDLLINEVLPVQILVRLGPDVQGAAGLPRLHSAPPGTYQYEASIFGLEPGTRYYYGVFDDDRLLAGADSQHYFTTLPEPSSGQPLRLWVVGDSGDGSPSQIAGLNAMRDFVAADGKPIDAYLHLGDMAYNIGRDDEFEYNFFMIYTELLRNTVVWPTMGNHEGATSSGVTQKGPYYDAYAVPTQGESGGVASGTEAYYSFGIGRAHFICLDSHDLVRSPTGEMALWLKADLEMADADWLIAFFHHPPYTKGTHDSDTETQLVEMRRHIMPILESGGVDLVLAGHSHIYERSMLIGGAYATPTVADGVILDDGDGDPSGHGAYRKSAALNPNEGTVAVVAGHGRSAARFYGVSPVMRSVITEVGSVVIDIDGDTLTSKMLNSAGVIRDEFQLVKRGEVTPEIVEFPWQPTGPAFRQERSAPGQTTIEIEADPPVPDAVVHYTLDGSEPTTSSPIYSGPVAISDDATVRAISVWRGGERVSLASASIPLDPWVSFQRYVSRPLDDGRQAPDGAVDLGAEALALDADSIVGLRFQDVNISKDAHIVRAQVEFEKGAGGLFLTSGNIWGESAPDSAPFDGVVGEFSNRAATASLVHWQASSWYLQNSRDFQSQTAELRGILREIIGQPGWQPGNPVSLFFQMNSGMRLAQAYESGRARAASLFVTYIDPDEFAANFAATPLRLRSIAGGGYQLTFRWPGAEAETALRLSYQLEGSADLRQWAPIQPTDLSPGFIGLDGLRDLTVTIGPEMPLAPERYYFRVRLAVGPTDPNPHFS